MRARFAATAIALIFTAALLGAPAVSAQDYPNRPIRLVIPYTAGGPVDFVARSMQARLQEILRQPIVIENKPGASAMIGPEFVAKAPPDGYTLLLGGVQTHAMNVATVKKMLYDPLRDFTPITQTTRVNWMIAAHPSFPARTPQELVTAVRASPGKYTYGSSGVGGASHLGFAMLSAELGMRFRVSKLPYALLIDEAGRVRAKGLVNSREQLESLFAARELGVASVQEYLEPYKLGAELAKERAA